MACETIANSETNERGVLHIEGDPLTSESMRTMIDSFLHERNFFNPSSIIAGGSDGGDCHNLGSGNLYTGQPIIIDIFPLDKNSMYNGDCTRTVVHGSIPAEVEKMHNAVVAAKVAGTAAVKAGISGELIHLEVIRVLIEHGLSLIHI